MPTISSIREDKLLGNLSAKYRNIEYVADKVFPFVPVKKNSDVYRVYERQFRLPNTDRAIGGEAREHNFLVSTGSYVLEKHALKEYVPDDLKDNYDIGDLNADTVEELTDTIMRRMENSVLSLFTTTNWSQNASLAAAAQWSANTTVSNPIIAVDSATSSVLQNSGKMANVGLINQDGMLAVKNHVSVLDRIKYVSAEIGENMIAALFGLEELLVARASQDTSAEGATSAISYLLEDNFWCGYRARPSLKSQGAGFIFRKPKPMVKRWREESRESEVVEVNMQYQAKIVSSLSGYLIRDILA